MSDSRARELWGKKFDVVEEGLDEYQITEFVDELIQERDTLLEQRNSLLSYIRLTKKIVGMENEQRTDSGQQAEDRVASILSGVGEDIQPEVKTIEPEPKQVTRAELPKATEVMEVSEDHTLYQGEVELEIPPPVDPTELLQFERRLRDSFPLKIVSTDGSTAKGCLIIVLLTELQPLLQGLMKMPEVEKAIEELDTSSQTKWSLLENLRSTKGKRIVVTLRKGYIHGPIDGGTR